MLWYFTFTLPLYTIYIGSSVTFDISNRGVRDGNVWNVDGARLSVRGG